MCSPGVTRTAVALILLFVTGTPGSARQAGGAPGPPEARQLGLDVFHVRTPPILAA
jgi:hypothetical protein